MFGHFEALVLSFPLEVDFGASWAVQVLKWAILGRQDNRRGSNLNSDVKNRCVWVQIDVLRGVFGPLSRALLEYRFYIGVMLGHFGGQNGEISAT